MKRSSLIIAVLTVFFGIVHTVSIGAVQRRIAVYDSYTFVVLPCKFTTPDCPEVTWYRQKGGKRSLLVQRKMDGRHTVSGEFRDRVGFENRGDLILIKPELNDSGNYSCEVDVDYDNPTWAKVEMELIVKQHTTTTKVPTTLSTSPVTSKPCVTDRSVSTQHGIRFMIFLDWIVPIVCTVLLVLRSGVQSIFSGGNWKNLLKSRRLAGIVLVVCGFFALGMVMVLVSILLLADVACSALETSQHNHVGAGLATGITGNIMLILMTVLICLKERIQSIWISADKKETEISKTDVEIPDIGKEDAVCEDAMEASPMQTLIPNSSESDNNKNVSMESSVVSSTLPFFEEEETGPQIKTMRNPSEERVVGMVSTSYKDVYFCTESKIFYKDVEKDTNNYDEISSAPSGKYITVSRCKDGIVATTQSRKQKSKVVPLLFIPEDKEKAYNMDVHFEGKRAWICVDPDGEHMYLTDFEGGRLVRTGPKGHKKEDIGIGVLKTPACVVQNQSGSLIVADPSKSDLFVFQKTGNFVTTVKISMPVNQVNDMKGCDKMAIDEDGKIFVSSPYSKNVLVFSHDFRFDRVIPTGTETSGVISSLMVVKDSLYVAHEDCIRIYPA